MVLVFESCLKESAFINLNFLARLQGTKWGMISVNNLQVKEASSAYSHRRDCLHHDSVTMIHGDSGSALESLDEGKYCGIFYFAAPTVGSSTARLPSDVLTYCPLRVPKMRRKEPL